jgi:hypothetical protein
MARLVHLVGIALLTGVASASGQDPGTLNPSLLPPLAHPDSPAKELFARKTKPVPLAARSIGFYSKGCLAGAVALPINGSTWQVMRLSRNRNWGHPKLIAFLERLASKGSKVGWNGLLVGDLSQPRGWRRSSLGTAELKSATWPSRQVEEETLVAALLHRVGMLRHHSRSQATLGPPGRV